MILLKQQKERTNKRQKFLPLKPLPFCLLFENNKEFLKNEIHPFNSPLSFFKNRKKLILHN